jgi:hypothetical protein
MSSSGGKFVLGAVRPGDRLVIGDVVFEAAMQDADETVAESA